MDVVEHCARVLAAWDGKQDAYDAKRGEWRGYYQRRAEGVLNTANYRGAVVDRDRYRLALQRINEGHHDPTGEADRALHPQGGRG